MLFILKLCLKMGIYTLEDARDLARKLEYVLVGGRNLCYRNNGQRFFHWLINKRR